MGLHFDTMGKLMYELRAVSKIPTDLDDLLKRALKKRNWLAHEFFRERAAEFMTSTGRQQMLADIDECRDLFQTADEALDNVVKPLYSAAGITEGGLEREYKSMLANL
jgi:hypothetical protein